MMFRLMKQRCWDDMIGECGHVFTRQKRFVIDDIVKEINGYPYCSNRPVLIGFNDLQSQRPEIAAQWHPTKNGNVKPCDVTCGAEFIDATGNGKKDDKPWWICPLGHEWQAFVYSRTGSETHKSTGCPYCANQFVWRGFNDFEYMCIQKGLQRILDEWDYDANTLEPLEILFDSNRRVHWKCKHGHRWVTTTHHRVIDKSDCPCCYGRVSHGENEVADTLSALYPELADEITDNRSAKVIPLDCGTERNESNKEIDVYIPSLHIGIEYNGEYWHSDEMMQDRYHMIAADYHSHKRDAAARIGIKLAYVWHDDWQNRRQEVLDALHALITTGAMNPILMRVDE